MKFTGCRTHCRVKKDWILGVDFGTTWSGVAFCNRGLSTQENDAGTIYSVRGYPKSGSLKWYPEVPSDLRYDSNGLIRMGYDIRNVVKTGIPGERINHFKLLLDDRETVDEPRQKIQQALRRIKGDTTSDSIISVITDYLVELLGFAKLYIDTTQRFGDDDTCEIVCTVPAMWSTRANRMMMKALQNAMLQLDEKEKGFNNDVKNIYLVSEPEAAAAYVLSKDSNLDLTVDDVFIVCDAGGGTVDLITYQVTRLGPLRLREIVGGKGGLCGSSYLDARYEAHLQERLGAETYLDEMSGKTKQQKIEHTIWDFENVIKCNFEGGEPVEIEVVIPGLRANTKKRFRTDVLILNTADLVGIFGPVVNQIWDLIKDQIQSAKNKNFASKSLFLVGGFAGSVYLQSELSKFCGALNPPIRLVTPEQDLRACAIVHGAIERSFNKADGPERICKSSIGLLQMEKFKPRYLPHKSAQRVLDSEENEEFVPQCVVWLLKKELYCKPTGHVVSHALYQTIPAEEETITLAAQILVLDRSAEDHYPRDSQMNRDCEPLEEVSFEFNKEQTKKIKAKLPVIYTKRPSHSPIAAQAMDGTAVVQARRSSRKTRSNQRYCSAGKNETKEQAKLAGKQTDNPILSSSRNSVQALSYETSPVDSRRQNEHTELAPQGQDDLIGRLQSIHFPDETSDGQLQEEITIKYHRLDYQFVLEVEGLIAKYRIECTVGGETYVAEGKSNIAHIFAPGTC